jgi:segregation and condensation protein B
METNTHIEARIEAILFFKGEPVTLAKLAHYLKTDVSEITQALTTLKERLEGRGIVLIQNGDEVTLGTAPEYSELIENLQKEELNKELSKASLETLSIVLYKNGASRAEIDYIRGVNSGFTLRALSVRGLVEKVPDATDSRKYIYKPTLELFSYLGIQNISQLPEYGDILKGLAQAEETLKGIVESA